MTGLNSPDSRRPVIDRHYPLDESAKALRYVEEGHTQGKVVVNVS